MTTDLMLPSLEKTTKITNKRFIILIARTVATKTTNAVLPSVQLYPASMVTGEEAEFSDEQNDAGNEVKFEYPESCRMLKPVTLALSIVTPLFVVADISSYCFG